MVRFVLFEPHVSFYFWHVSFWRRCTLRFADYKKQIPLYSASVATILQNNESRFRDLEGIAEAVNVLFSKFPVPILPQYK